MISTFFYWLKQVPRPAQIREVEKEVLSANGRAAESHCIGIGYTEEQRNGDVSVVSCRYDNDEDDDDS